MDCFSLQNVEREQLEFPSLPSSRPSSFLISGEVKSQDDGQLEMKATDLILTREIFWVPFDWRSCVPICVELFFISREIYNL